jgi:hypothetical protein
VHLVFCAVVVHTVTLESLSHNLFTRTPFLVCNWEGTDVKLLIGNSAMGKGWLIKQRPTPAQVSILSTYLANSLQVLLVSLGTRNGRGLVTSFSVGVQVNTL